MPTSRKVANWLFVKLANVLFGTHYTDITYGYNAVWREHVHTLAPEVDGWAHEIVGSIRAARNGLRVVEVACLERPRIAGEAKLRALQAGWVILVAILQEPFKNPARSCELSDLQVLLPESTPLLEAANSARSDITRAKTNLMERPATSPRQPGGLRSPDLF